MGTLALTTVWWADKRDGAGDVYPATADLIELLELLDSAGCVTGPLCRYAQIALDRRFIRLSATEPAGLAPLEVFRARRIAAEVTDEGRAWMDERLGLG